MKSAHDWFLTTGVPLTRIGSGSYAGFRGFEEKDIAEVQRDALQSFGTFRVELWEDDEYVVTCGLGPLGGTMHKKHAEAYAERLNADMAKYLKKVLESNASVK